MRSFLIPLIALAAGACAAGSAGRPARDPGRSRSDLISAAEIAQVQRISAFDAIHTLRPLFLIPRGRMQGNEPVVYLNGLRYGSIAMLRGISAQDLAEVRWLSPIDATQRYGTGHGGGAILLFTHASAPTMGR